MYFSLILSIRLSYSMFLPEYVINIASKISYYLIHRENNRCLKNLKVYNNLAYFTCFEYIIFNPNSEKRFFFSIGYDAFRSFIIENIYFAQAE